MAQLQSSNIKVSSASFGDGSPTYKIWSDNMKVTVDGNMDANNPKFSYMFYTSKGHVECTKGDGLKGFGTTVYVTINLALWVPASGRKTSASKKVKIEKKGSSGETVSWGGYESTMTIKDTGLATNPTYYHKGYSDVVTGRLDIEHEFKRSVPLMSDINWSRTEAGSCVPLPGFAYLKDTSIQVVKPSWLWKNTIGGTWGGINLLGCAGTSFGERTFGFKFNLICNCSGTAVVTMTGVAGTAKAKSDSCSFGTAVSAGINSVTSITSSHYWYRGVYRVDFSFIESGNKWTGSFSNVITPSGVSTNKQYIYFYAPTDPGTPPNSNPSFSISNTTSTSINTNQTKNISVRITLNDTGVSQYWLSKMVYTVTAYWNDGTKIGSWTVNDSDMNNLSAHNTDFSTTVQIRSTKRQQEEYVYWTVSGYSVDTSGKTRYGTTQTSGKVNLFWAYVEPSKVAFGASKITSSSGPTFSNNRAQLYYGGTTIGFTLSGTINAWGDRPGSRNYEFSLNHGGSAVKYYGKNVTSDTGTKSHTYTYTIPDNWVNSSADFTIYKRLDNTEYLASSDPKNPAKGTNHASGGTISFYETIGAVSGMIDIKPSILMVTIPSSITGQGQFDKQSSQKVRYYVEVFDRDTNQVVNQYGLGNTVGDITKIVTIDLSSASFTVPEPHLYELRLKADVTELLGNVHTYTFYTTTRQSFLPPRYTLTESSDELLPPNSDSSLLIRQKATNTYTYKVDYDLALSSSLLTLEYYLAGSPNIKRTKQINIIPSGYGGGGFYGSYTLTNPSKLDPSDPMYDPEGFALGTKVTAKVSSTWNMPGVTTIYSNSSGTIYYDVTPTRYIYFLTRGIENEQWLNKVHNATPTRTDRVSKKIFVETDIS